MIVGEQMRLSHVGYSRPRRDKRNNCREKHVLRQKKKKEDKIS